MNLHKKALIRRFFSIVSASTHISITRTLIDYKSSSVDRIPLIYMGFTLGNTMVGWMTTTTLEWDLKNKFMQNFIISAFMSYKGCVMREVLRQNRHILHVDHWVQSANSIIRYIAVDTIS